MICRATVKRPAVLFTKPLQDRRQHRREYVRGMASIERASAARRTGRPRRSGIFLEGDPRTEILAVASRLFAERGVGSTTMAEIARRSGLQQSSVYYYFGSKEQVVEAVVSEANRAPLELVNRIRDDPARPAVQLHRIIRADVAALCALPYDLNELHRLAARDPETFARYWRERRRLERALTEVVEAGIAAGELLAVDPELTAVTILSNDEATQNWLRNGPGRVDKKSTPLSRAYAVGTFLADLTLRGLLSSPRSLDTVRRRADALDARAAVTR
jgi:AcrR family transcriptional regulator